MSINVLVTIEFKTVLTNPFFGTSTEGTTTNGHYLLPFKTGAFLAKAPVLPIILRYPYERLSPAWDSISGVSSYSLTILLSIVLFSWWIFLIFHFSNLGEKLLLLISRNVPIIFSGYIFSRCFLKYLILITI